MLRIMLIVLVVHFSGCVIPTLEEEPYQTGDIVTVHPGETARDVILKLFGEPNVSREHDAIWLYGEYHSSALVVTGVGSWNVFSVEDYQFLVVEFEKDTVKSIELVEDRFGCSSSGICLRYGWRIPKFFDKGESPGIWISMLNQNAIVASERADDKLAKEFQKISNKCSLYFYQEYEVGRVTVDSIRNIFISEGTYLYLLLEPGWHRIMSTHGEEFNKHEFVEKRFECRGGEIVFVEFAEKPWSWGTKPIINVVDHESGGRAIKRRNVILFP